MTPDSDIINIKSVSKIDLCFQNEYLLETSINMLLTKANVSVNASFRWF